MRRTVITGIGVVAPGGLTRDAFWARIIEGHTATGPITLFDTEGLRSRIASVDTYDGPVEEARARVLATRVAAQKAGPDIVSGGRRVVVVERRPAIRRPRRC